MKKLRWIPVIAYAGFILYVSVRALFYHEILPPHVDKLIHLALYSVLGFGLVWALRATRFRYHPHIVLIATAVCVFYGATTEFIQSFVPGRSAEAFDLVADGIGGIAGAWIAAATAHYLRGEGKFAYDPAIR